ncbi:MAG: hypothetical protein A4E47_01186 [Methanosaeta sp. PtaU1.Bin028]|nr:MAG: hypothetical protein A4E47_01186 [Methanosaeta sp. PtaU1.Bin028]
MIKELFVAAVILLTPICSGEQPMWSVDAAEIWQQVFAGEPVQLENFVVTGHLNLSNLDPPLVRARFSLVNCTVAPSDFTGVTFQDLADFSGSTLDAASFSQAVFADDAGFYDTDFRGPVDFNYTRFEGYNYFAGALFEKEASFYDAYFQEFADFGNARFLKGCLFIKARFIDGAGFLDSRFDGSANFMGASFESFSSFADAVFNGTAYFGLAHFVDAIQFRDVAFDGDAIFGLAQMDLAEFNGSTMAGQVNFKSASIESLLLENVSFGRDAKVNLRSAKFTRMTTPWQELRGHLVYDGAVYLALARNYRDLEWFGDADWCYFDYRQENRRQKAWGVEKVIDYLSWLSCGYGVRPSYPLIWSMTLIALFGLAFFLTGGIRRSGQPAQDEKPNLDRHQEAPIAVPTRPGIRDCIYFSALIFLSTGPLEFLPVGRYRYLIIMEGIFGWLFMALLFVTLGRVMIR